MLLQITLHFESCYVHHFIPLKSFVSFVLDLVYDEYKSCFPEKAAAATEMNWMSGMCEAISQRLLVTY